MNQKHQMHNPKGRRLVELSKDQNVKYILIVGVSFLLGMWYGRHMSTTSPSSTSNPSLLRGRTPGSIHRLSDTPIRNTSHTDNQNRPITKQQLIEPFVISHIAGVSVATLLSNQNVDGHQHESMHEFFYILEGKVTFTIDGKTTLVEEGTLVHVSPHEVHQLDAKDGTAKMLVSGFTEDDR